MNPVAVTTAAAASSSTPSHKRLRTKASSDPFVPTFGHRLWVRISSYPPAAKSIKPSAGSPPPAGSHSSSPSVQYLSIFERRPLARVKQNSLAFPSYESDSEESSESFKAGTLVAHLRSHSSARHSIVTVSASNVSQSPILVDSPSPPNHLLPRILYLPLPPPRFP